MKNIILITVLFLISLTSFSQNKIFIPKKDSITYNTSKINPLVLNELDKFLREKLNCDSVYLFNLKSTKNSISDNSYRSSFYTYSKNNADINEYNFIFKIKNDTLILDRKIEFVSSNNNKTAFNNFNISNLTSDKISQFKPHYSEAVYKMDTFNISKTTFSTKDLKKEIEMSTDNGNKKIIITTQGY